MTNDNEDVRRRIENWCGGKKNAHGIRWRTGRGPETGGFLLSV
jgi:hypothetical protein